VNLGIDPLPQGYLSASKLQGCVPLCANFNFVPLAEGSPSVISQSWRIDKTPVIMDQPDRFAKCFNSPGNYLISGLINAANGCVNTLTYVVNAYPQPVADFTFSPQYPIENTEPVTFINTSAGKGLKTFSWFFIDNTGFTDNQRNTSYLFADAGNYAVAMKVEDENGCSDTIVKNITINPDFVFYVPNAFTPNGDDHNEVFIPVSRGVKFYEFHVFNRWGQRIFATTSALSGWDGSFNGKACPQDTYVWKAVVSTTNGEMKEFTGTVTLFR
jgi:gliding motility-associated-like protein